MTTGGIAAERLLGFVERIERLEDEKREVKASIEPELKLLAGEIADVKKEAASAGFDAKALKVILDERRPRRLAEPETVDLSDVYRRALGDLGDTPLGEAAVASRVAGRRAAAEAH